MRFYRLMFVVAGLLIVFWLGGCGNQNEMAEGEDSTDGLFEVFVVNYPLKYFTERIAGNLVAVHFPAPVGVDPVYWSPDTEVLEAEMCFRWELSAFGNADLPEQLAVFFVEAL